MKIQYFVLAIIFSVNFTVLGSDLKITNGEFQMLEDEKGQPEVYYRLDISWNNSWRNDRNFDAVWLFFKAGNRFNMKHLQVVENGLEYINVQNSKGPSPAFIVPEDKMGIFVYPSENYRGDINWSIRVKLNPEALNNVRAINLTKVFGLEMVYIPEGKFTLGDPDERALNYGALYKSDSMGQPKGLYTIESENEIDVDASEDNLFYKVQNEAYQGDQKGPIPKMFPKGYDSFFVMKYELKQREYVDFLNNLTEGQSQNRANFGGKNYYANRGGIFMENEKYETKFPNRPINYCSWDDGMAFADWAGLRPMTEFEFTKATRGTSVPIEMEFPWNSNSKKRMQRFINSNGDLVCADGLDESMLNDKNKDLFGASYYWVMDMAGSLWERVVTIGHAAGRSFKGSHGDGLIGEYGFANSADWPSGIKDKGGIGFRGGGFYESNRDYHNFNPHSPIAYRRYGAWHGWNRTIAYGQRFVRTIKQ